MKRRKSRNKINLKNKKTEMNSKEFILFMKKIALFLGSFLIFGFFSLVLTQEISQKPMQLPHLVQDKNLKHENLKIQMPTLTEYKREENDYIRTIVKPKKHTEYPRLTSTLKLQHKADGDILYLKSKKLRITFKENKLIASQKELFKESQIDPNTLYCTLKGVDSELKGYITDKFRKQYFADRITIRQSHHKLTLKIRIKHSCSYTRSAWARKSGLDLLTFNCE